MPYKIYKLPNRELYRVKNKETGEILSKGTTKEKAEAQVRLLYKIENEKGSGKILPKYTAGLKGKEKKAQIKSIEEGKDRPKTSAPYKKSKWTKMIEEYFGKTPTLKEIAKELKLKSTKGLEEIIKKGEGAYYSSGSRPNTTARQWGLARLYSVLFGGKSRRIDNKIVEKYNIPLLSLEDKKTKGNGLFSWLKRKVKRAKKKVKETFGRPTTFSNTSRKTLENYGNCPIVGIKVMRTPIQKPLNIALHGLSFGKWFGLMKKYGFDKFYHLGLVLEVRCEDGVIRPVVMEKNEVVNISNAFSISNDSEFMSVPYNPDQDLTLNKIVKATREKMGDKLYFDYDAFKNNCQNFVASSLDSVGLLNDRLLNFLFQDLSKLYNDLPKHLSPVAKVITRLGSIVSRLRGAGGKVADYLEKKDFPENYDMEVEKVIDTMSFDKNNVDILGSMSFRSIKYSSDYDCFEVVYVKSIDELADKFKKIIRDIQNSPNMYITDVKIGSIDDWKVLNENMYYDSKGKLRLYNRAKSLQKLKSLKEDEIIKPEEYKTGEKLLVENPKIEDVKAMIKFLRFNILRWKPNEILGGVKTLRNGEKYTLKEALGDKTLFKLDVIAYIDEKYTEFSIIYDVRLNNHRLNYTPIDTKKTLKNDIMLYQKTENYFKLLKRLFSLYNYEIKYDKKDKNKEIVKVLQILNSDIGELYTITQDIDVLVELLKEDEGNTEKIKKQIDMFRTRLGNVYDKEYLKIEGNILKMIHKILGISNKSKMIDYLEYTKDVLFDTLNNRTKEKMIKMKITPFN